MTFSEADSRHMEHALELALRGDTGASPNPVVGAVLLDPQGAVIGEGWHECPGQPHAEVMALAKAGAGAKGGTLYVTLEPCAHFGRTPPCTDAIIRAGVSRVVFALHDPNARASGGAERLSAAGIDVSGGLLADRALRQNRAHVSMAVRARPWVVGKFAATLDGRVATRHGESKWITSEASRAEAHALRAWSDAVLVGVGTIRADDPKLDARTPTPPIRPPMRVVVDTFGRLPPNPRFMDRNLPGDGVIMTTNAAPFETRREWLSRSWDVAVLPADPRSRRVSLTALLNHLKDREAVRILVEGGPTLLGAFADDGLLDEIVAFLAPCIMGGAQSRGAVEGVGPDRLSEMMRLEDVEVRTLGADLMVRGVVADRMGGGMN